MTFWYLASPYDKFPGGHEAAYVEAVNAAALLLRARVPVFCPIAHSHPIATVGGITDEGHDFWVEFVDKPFMDAAYGIIVLLLRGWDESRGVQHEIQEFMRTRKPQVYMFPDTVPPELRNWNYEEHS